MLQQNCRSPEQQFKVLSTVVRRRGVNFKDLLALPHSRLLDRLAPAPPALTVVRAQLSLRSAVAAIIIIDSMIQ